MKTATIFSATLLLVSGLLAGCTDPYLPTAIQNPPRYLVVDGFINSQGPTTIRLSHAYAIATTTAPPVETRATVYVEQENGPRFVLSESPIGTYSAAARTLDPGRKYRLHLTTLAGLEYLTDYQAVVTTPAFDTFGWRAESDGLKIFVGTHNAADASHYYRWEYEETWETIPVISPALEWRKGLYPILVPYPRICWGNEVSTTIKLFNTTRLTQNKVVDYVVRTVPTTSPRLHDRYSILVSQMAQSENEYHYWELLKKNTENIGTLFDPQPVQLTGNVRCVTKPADLALGFVGVHSVEQRRLFVVRSQLPYSWRLLSDYDNCVPDTIRGRDISQAFITPNYVPINYSGAAVLGIGRSCVDCRLHGIPVKPSFWP